MNNKLELFSPEIWKKSTLKMLIQRAYMIVTNHTYRIVNSNIYQIFSFK